VVERIEQSMKVDIQSRQVELTQELKAHIQRKLNFALSRMDSYITAISVNLSVVNGPKDDLNKQCGIKICIANMEDILIKDTQANLYFAIDRAAQRASQALNSKIGRQYR